jgi:predicted MFS family arabinose efflux permease
MLLCMLALSLLLPRDAHSTATPRTQVSQSWRLLLNSRVAIGVLVSGFLSTMANDNLFVIYGEWLESSFALGVVALGATTTVIGVAELIGEILTATVSDRLGLKRAAIGGTLLTTLSYALLPFMDKSLTLALIGLFVIFLIFEFTVVTTASMLTELLPEARATLLSAMMALSGLGRVIGALLGGELWGRGELPAIGLTSALLSAIGIGFFVWGLWRWQADERLHN